MRNFCAQGAVVGLLALGLTASAAGCADMRPPRIRAPWAIKETKSDPRFPTPKERLEQLAELRKDGPRQSAEEQDQLARALGEQIATELDPIIRVAQYRVVAVLQGPTSHLVLAQGLGDADRDVRIACCDALAERGGPDATRLLCQAATSDADADVRLAGLRALGKTRDATAVAALGSALEDSSPAIQYRAMRSLEEVTGERLGYDVHAWRQYVQSGAPPREETLAERLRRLF